MKTKRDWITIGVWTILLGTLAYVILVFGIVMYLCNNGSNTNCELVQEK